MTKVLDPCCGSKMFWFDKDNPNVTFCDIRNIDNHEYYPGRFLEVKPDVQCDFRHLPFADESFWHIVFDPPHMIRCGKNHGQERNMARWMQRGHK